MLLRLPQSLKDSDYCKVKWFFMKATHGNCAIVPLVFVFSPWLLLGLSAHTRCHFFFSSLSISPEVQKKFHSSTNASLPCVDFITLSFKARAYSSEKISIGRAVLSGRWAWKKHPKIDCSCTVIHLPSRVQLPFLRPWFYFSITSHLFKETKI